MTYARGIRLLALSLLAILLVACVATPKPELTAMPQTLDAVEIATAAAKGAVKVENLKQVARISQVIFVVGLLLGGVGVVLLFLRQFVIGVTLICIGVVAAVVSPALVEHYEDMAKYGYYVLMGFFALFAAVSAFAAVMWIRARTVSKETVKLIDTKIKPRLPDPARRELFGDNGIAANTLTKRTKAAIAEMRGKKNK